MCCYWCALFFVFCVPVLCSALWEMWTLSSEPSHFTHNWSTMQTIQFCMYIYFQQGSRVLLGIQPTFQNNAKPKQTGTNVHISICYEIKSFIILVFETKFPCYWGWKKVRLQSNYELESSSCSLPILLTAVVRLSFSTMLNFILNPLWEWMAGMHDALILAKAEFHQ